MVDKLQEHLDVSQGNSGTFVFWHININPFPDVSDNGDGVQFFNRLTPLLWKGSFEWKICMIIDSSLIYIIPLSDYVLWTIEDDMSPFTVIILLFSFWLTNRHLWLLKYWLQLVLVIITPLHVIVMNVKWIILFYNNSLINFIIQTCNAIVRRDSVSRVKFQLFHSSASYLSARTSSDLRRLEN